MSRESIRQLVPGDEGLLSAFLQPRLESSMFLLGNMKVAGLADRGQVYQGTYMAAFDTGNVVGAVAHFWNGNLVLQAPLPLVDPLWRSAVRVSQQPVKGVIGPGPQVRVALESLNPPPGLVLQDETELLYRLDLSALRIPEPLAKRRLRGRRIETRDLDLVVAWRVAFAIESLGAQDSDQLWDRTRASMARLQQQGRTWILEDEGAPVAMSSFNAVVDRAVQIGGVWTPRKLRRRGYGRAVVAASLLDVRAEGAALAILFTGAENIPAQKAYEALGFVHIGDYRLVLLGEPGIQELVAE